MSFQRLVILMIVLFTVNVGAKTSAIENELNQLKLNNIRGELDLDKEISKQKLVIDELVTRISRQDSSRLPQAEVSKSDLQVRLIKKSDLN